jgi:hypothetical protein
VLHVVLVGYSAIFQMKDESTPSAIDDGAESSSQFSVLDFRLPSEISRRNSECIYLETDTLRRDSDNTAIPNIVEVDVDQNMRSNEPTSLAYGETEQPLVHDSTALDHTSHDEDSMDLIQWNSDMQLLIADTNMFPDLHLPPEVVPMEISQIDPDTFTLHSQLLQELLLMEYFEYDGHLFWNQSLVSDKAVNHAFLRSVMASILGHFGSYHISPRPFLDEQLADCSREVVAGDGIGHFQGLTLSEKTLCRAELIDMRLRSSNQEPLRFDCGLHQRFDRMNH